MSQVKENEFVFCGIVDDAPVFQFTPQGKCKGKVKVKREESYTYQGETRSNVTILTFSLFGKPAEDAMALDLKLGTAVRMTGSFGSYEAKNKEKQPLGFHNPDLKAYRVDVRSEQPKPNNSDIDF